MATTRRSGRNPAVTVITVIVVIWLLIGVAAAAQRHYFNSSSTNCAKVSATAVTILAGPLNYVGVNPRIACKVPQPSK
jgi:membrane protein YdbS with pleckstrin-like domain